MSYIDRLVKEIQELNTKIISLEDFIDGAFFEALTKEDQELLVDQAAYMDAYASVLTQRIEKVMYNG